MDINLFYTVEIKNASAHLLDISLTVTNPKRIGQQFFLPSWIPGSYLIREFSRNIIKLSAHDGNNKNVEIKKLRKNIWQTGLCEGSLTVTYQIYASEWSVRTAMADDELVFFNGTSIFLAAADKVNEPCQIKIIRPKTKQFASWQIATALQSYENLTDDLFGTYFSKDYDELVDNPVILGEIKTIKFSAYGVPHEVALVGLINKLDSQRIKEDLGKICEQAIALFEPKTKQVPFEHYVFILLLDADGYGGLEHRTSSVLLCSKSSLPTKNRDPGEEYIRFLELCSHEYFHAWNIKRIKPIEFTRYNYIEENYTNLLWLFEGFTSYYENLILVRSKLITENEYLSKLTKTFKNVLEYTGRLKQTVAESSFDTWIKYYRPDENTCNAVVSYYSKGSMIGLAFDLKIRAESQGEKSLDDVIRHLWNKYGESFYQGKPIGITEKDFLKSVKISTEVDINSIFQLAVHSCEDLPLNDLLDAFGLTLKRTPTKTSPDLGIHSRVKKNGGIEITSVLDNSPAQQAGLSANDTIVAIEEQEIRDPNLSHIIEQYQVNTEIKVHIFRRGTLKEKIVKLNRTPSSIYHLKITRDTAQKKSLRYGWLK